MAIIGEKITLDKTLVGNIARNQMESKMELTTKGALYVGTGKANSVTPDGGGDAVPIPITSHIAPNGARDNGKVLVADSNETVGWKLDVGANIVYKKMSGSLPTTGWNTLDEGWKRNTLPARGSWESVAYGDGKFVALYNWDDSSAIGAYSTDGITWAATTIGREMWRSVTYGDGKFVAVAQSTHRGAYSTDGINWTTMSMPASRGWKSVTYGNGKFVAIAMFSDKGAYSTDGINWTEMSVRQSNQVAEVTYGNGKFVAVVGGRDGAYSTDGIDWSFMSLSEAGNWITYGDGKFVTNGAYSTDGINWTDMSMPAGWGGCSATYGNGKFVVVGNSAAVAHSTDGINWTTMSLPAKQDWRSVTYGNGKFVAVAADTQYGAYWTFTPATYTITDTDITTNTSVKMYLTDKGGVKAYNKAQGSITVIRDPAPTVAIPYEYEVEQTSAEGLFEVLNSYVPTVPIKMSELTNDRGFASVGDWVIVTGEQAYLTEAGTYEVLIDKEPLIPSYVNSLIFSWDGKQAVQGPSCTFLTRSSDAPYISTLYPYVSNDYLSICGTTIEMKNNSWTVTEKTYTGFKYRKIN